jgi:hypothetical protein
MIKTQRVMKRRQEEKMTAKAEEGAAECAYDGQGSKGLIGWKGL